jgi:CBS domain-containing protein
VARIMVQNDVKRVPVTENGKLVGMLTRYDMIRRMAQRRG